MDLLVGFSKENTKHDENEPFSLFSTILKEETCTNFINKSLSVLNISLLVL